MKEHFHTTDVDAHVPFKKFHLQLSYNARVELIRNKKDEEVKKVVPINHQVSLEEYMIDFTEELVPKIIYYRNMLHLFRNTKQIFTESFLYAYMDIWSLHWSKKQMTVDSGITKTNYGKKVYHPYVFDSSEHDLAFVNFAMNTILSLTDLKDVKQILIESDNYSGHYKSAQHFYDLQNIANHKNKIVIRFYRLEGLGKGEVNHVGGIAKVSTHEITRGAIFSYAAQVVSHLVRKLWTKENPYTSSEKLLFPNLKMREHNDVKNFSKQSMGLPPFMSWFSNRDSHFSLCLLEFVFVKNAPTIMDLVIYFHNMNLIYVSCRISQCV